MAIKTGRITKLKLWPKVMSFDVVVDGLTFRTTTDAELPTGNALTSFELLKDAYFGNRTVRLTYNHMGMGPIVINGVSGIEVQ